MPPNTNTEIALLKQEVQYIKEWMTRMETMMKDFISTANSTFATKQEHEQNKIKIQSIEDAQSKVVWSILWTFWTLIIWFIAFVLKKLWVI
jgi:hypothetical protein